MAQPPHQNVVHPWQGNPGSAPYNPLLNGNGSNYSSRTGSPAQPPPAVSGLTMGVQQMSLKQNLPLPNGNRVANGPLNGNSGPPVNGNQNVRGTFQHQQTQFQPLPTPQFQTQPTSPPQGPPQFQAPQQQFPPKEPANVPPSNFQVPQQRPFTAPQSNFPQTNSGPPTSFGSQTPQGPNFGSNPLPQANSGPVFGSQPPPQPRSGSSTGTQPPSQMNSGPSFGSNPLPQVSSGPNFGSQPLQTSSGPNFGSKPLPQANPGPNFGSQPLPQVNSGPNFGSKPLPQVNSGPNFGSQPLPQANPGPNFGSKPLVQANSGQNFGSKPLHQTSSGPVFGGQPPPQPSSGQNFGNQPLPQANPGPNFGAQPPPQTNSGPLQQKRPLYPAGTPMQPAMLQRPQVQSPLLQQPLAQQQQQQFNGFSPDGSKMQYQGQQSVLQTGFNKIWGHETLDLMQNRHILPPAKVDPPSIKLNHQFHEAVNCNPDIFRCTLNKVPESNNLLQKSRLPLGVLIHPFRDLNNLPVITSSTIVRCRVCRTYINPFVYFVDSKKWKCNLCYRVNDLPDEFLYDPVSKTYGDPTRRPEVKSSTIEFIAPSEYTLRPPQPAIFLFLLDVSSIAQQSGYLQVVCDVITEQLDKLPGDTRKQMGFIAYNSSVNFYNIAENFNQPHEVTVLDLEDIFLPFPDNLVVNLKLCKDLIKDLLTQLPKRFENNHDPYSSLGAALQAAYKLLSPTGGRITVFQTCLPNYGPGCLQPREDPNNRSSKDIQHLGPATDFYKRLALDCSGQQIAVDLFLLNSQYSDLATLSGISKFSGGCIHHFPLFNASKPNIVKSFKQCFERYLTRKIGFEAVMRVRCTRGLQIHTFHGNFFVRSTDLLSLPNINPDAGFGLQISYEESLVEVKTVCFQAALLYTSSNGERRIRVHTLCLPVSASLSEIILSADVQCIIGLLTKMAVDRSLASNLSDARDAFINATVDILSAYKLAQNLPGNASGLLVPSNLSLFPLYILALLKHTAFRTGTSTRLDDRVFAMCEMKTLPLDQLMKYIYPDFYCIDCLFNRNGENVAEPSRLQLSAEHLDTRSVFCLDGGSYVIIYIGSNVPPPLLSSILGVSSINEVPEVCYSLPELKTPDNEALHAFIDTINEDKPYAPIIQVIRDSSATRPLLTEKFVDDRNDSSLSYYEFLQHIKTQIK